MDKLQSFFASKKHNFQENIVEDCEHCKKHHLCLEDLLKTNRENMARIEDLLNCKMCDQRKYKA